jgi:hypothetical protein
MFRIAGTQGARTRGFADKPQSGALVPWRATETAGMTARPDRKKGPRRTPGSFAVQAQFVNRSVFFCLRPERRQERTHPPRVPREIKDFSRSGAAGFSKENLRSPTPLGVWEGIAARPVVSAGSGPQGRPRPLRAITGAFFYDTLNFFRATQIMFSVTPK